MPKPSPQPRQPLDWAMSSGVLDCYSVQVAVDTSLREVVLFHEVFDKSAIYPLLLQLDTFIFRQVLPTT